MSIALIAFLVLIAAFAIGSFTKINAGLIALVAAFGVGLTSVVAQVLVPYAASLADDASRGKVVGTVVSGILAGIIGARVLAGLLGGVVGWRLVYAGAAGLTAGLMLLLARRLPAETVRHRRNGRADVPYREVLRGVARLARELPGLRLRAAYGFCGFAVFSAIWTTLAFHLREQYDLGGPAVAAVALLGLFGAILTPRVGAFAGRGRESLVTGGAYAVLLAGAGLLALGATSLPVLLLAVVVCDLAVNSGHVTNLGVVYRLAPHARSSATTVYITTVFLGGATGSVLAATAYARRGFIGVAEVSAAFAATALVLWLTRLTVPAPRALDEPWPEAIA